MTAAVDVMKIGGSVLTGPERLPRIAAALAGHAAGRRLLVVVSALRGVTDGLEALALRLCSMRDPEGWAALLATGERQSAAALILALRGLGQAAALLDPGDVGPWTQGPALDAWPVAVDVRRIRRTLERAPVAVLPGFLGRDEAGCTTLLGRGGSDLTALFLADALLARCFLIKDAGGVFSRDPSTGRGRRYEHLTWDEAARTPGEWLQPKALAFACEREVTFHVGSLERPATTRVGRVPERSPAPEITGSAAADTDVDADARGA